MNDANTGTLQWREAFAQLDLLLALDEAARAPALAALAASRRELYPQVLTLLRATLQAQAEERFEQGALSELTASAPDTQFSPGMQWGPYRCERLLGAGGMGEVWLANRTDGLYQGQVAIKCLHAHLSLPGLRERFAREGQILGKLKHPNIARLLDAGVAANGLLFLVLEYVEGERIDRWCDTQTLNLAARLKLFLEVCAALAHAHAHLVVHRDLKPSNILVTAQGEVKLLDFGIAKLLEGEGVSASGTETELTRLSGRALTPEYAAPEQLLGGAITTVTDVYTLGVLLCQLLCGQRPHGESQSTAARLERAVLESEPRRPSQLALLREPDGSAPAHAACRQMSSPKKLAQALRGDLDNIVAKALKKDPLARYPSVLALADDIQHYLDDEPVSARGDPFGYRAAKFVRRHRAATAAALLILVLIIAGVAGTTWQARVATRAEGAERAQREQVEARETELQQVVEFQGAMLRRVDVSGFGTDFYKTLRERLVRRLAQGEVHDLPHPGDALAVVDRLRPYANLTDVARDTLAADLLGPAAEALQTQLKEHPESEAGLTDSLAQADLGIGLWAQAEPLFARAAVLHEQRGSADAAAALKSHLFHARTLILLDRYEEARSETEAVVTASRLLLGAEHPDTLQAEAQQAATLKRLGHYAEAEAIEQRVLLLQRRLLGEDHPDTLETFGALGTTYLFEQKLDDALRVLAQAAAAKTRVLGPVKLETIATRRNYGTALKSRGSFLEAKAVFSGILEDLRRIYGDDYPHSLGTQSLLASCMIGLGDMAGAMKLEKAVIESQIRLFGPDSFDVLTTQNNYALDLRDSGQIPAAIELLANIVARRTRLQGAEHPETLNAVNNLAVTLRAHHELNRAQVLGETALAGQTKVLGPEHRSTIDTRAELAETYHQLGDKTKALSFGERALSDYRKVLGDTHGDTLDCMQSVVGYRRSAGDLAGANALAAELKSLRAKRKAAAAS